MSKTVMNFAKLKDLCSFENGDRGKNYPSEEDFISEGIPFINGSSIEDNKINLNSLKFISEDKYNSLRSGKAKRGDILFSLRGSLDKCVINPFDKASIASALVIIRPKNIVSNDYLYLMLQTDYFKSQCQNYDNGSVQANLSVAVLKELLIPVMTDTLQKSYVIFARNLNNKILNNIKQIETLESLVKTIYDYWFVQFDFPNEEGKPYKSSGGKMVWNEELKREIPEGWNSSSLMNLLVLLKDGTHNPPKRIKMGVPLLTGNIFGDFFIKRDNATYISEEDYKKIHSQYEPLCGDIILTKIGTIGNVNYIRDSDLPLAIHCNSALLRFKNEFGTYMPLFLLKSQLFQNRLNSMKGKSVQEFVSLSRIGSITIEKPSQKLITKFNDHVFPIMKKIEKLTSENECCLSLKNYLLPLLMNGQVQIK